MRTLLRLLPVVFWLPISAFSLPRAQYLHIEGSTTTAYDPNTILNQIETFFTASLLAHSKEVIFSNVFQASGTNQVDISLVVEPTAADTGFFNQYIQQLESQSFLGFPVKFVEVVGIYEKATLQIGDYDANTDSAFDLKTQVSRDFYFNTIAEFINFGNRFGYAFEATDHSAFLDYLKQFLPSPEEYQYIHDQFLVSNNMVQMLSKPKLWLADGTIVKSNIEQSPFLPFIMARNCWWPNLENGNCGP